MLDYFSAALPVFSFFAGPALGDHSGEPFVVYQVVKKGGKHVLVDTYDQLQATEGMTWTLQKLEVLEGDRYEGAPDR